MAFTAKDALLVVDDFVPTGGPGDGELQGTAERLFRMLIVELQPAEVGRCLLSECQNAARQGQLAAAMGAFLSWIAERYEELQQRLQARTRELRNQYLLYRSHARLPTALAELQSGWEIWLQFALEAGGIDTEQQIELANRGGKALEELAALQAPWQVANDPALRFVALLQSALASGHAHVADGLGGVPEAASLWGWRRKPNGRKWIACGACIGWVAGNDLYLDSLAGSP